MEIDPAARGGVDDGHQLPASLDLDPDVGVGRLDDELPPIGEDADDLGAEGGPRPGNPQDDQEGQTDHRSAPPRRRGRDRRPFDGLDRPDHGAGRCRTRGRVACHQRRDEGGGGRRQPRVKPLGRLGRRHGQRREDGERIGAVEGQPTRGHLIEDAAEAEEVAEGRDRPATRLLGAHVVRRAGDLARLAPVGLRL